MNSDIMPYEITRTLLGIKNELIAMSNEDLVPQHNTTLNHKWGVQPAVDPPNKPMIAYIGIGIGGEKNIDDSNLRTPELVTMKNMDLYQPIPFRCVPVDEDISAAERENYRMRVRRTFNDNDYWCYYLKKIVFNSDVEFTITNPDTLEEEPYTLNTDNLNPSPPDSDSDGVSEVNVFRSGIVELYGSEVLESISVIYGDPRKAIISEIGIYTGHDMQVTGQAEGGTINYMESTYAQLAIHYTSLGTPFLSPGAYKKIPINIGKGNLMLV